ncbi:MAG TPA: hypothetical protein VEZ12_14755, partial [Herpetosiphonaceae bacterium]|nr:hypothetical protein [Herpetosiphonaceae bacterium]
MATLNILTPEELASRDQKSRSKGVGRGRRRSAERTRIIEGFKEVLQQAEPGYGADVLLGEDEHKRTVRQNLKAAADELGMALEFRPIKVKNRIHFRVITLEEKAALPKRPGRPRKVLPEAVAETSVEALQETNGTEPPAAPVRSRRRRNQPQEARS